MLGPPRRPVLASSGKKSFPSPLWMPKRSHTDADPVLHG